MRDPNHIDWNIFLDSYRETYASFSKAQHEGLRALERFARFQYAVAGDVLEAGLAQAKATLGARAAIGTQAVAEEFSALAAEVQESVGSFAAAAEHRARAENGRHASRKAAA